MQVAQIAKGSEAPGSQIKNSHRKNHVLLKSFLPSFYLSSGAGLGTSSGCRIRKPGSYHLTRNFFGLQSSLKMVLINLKGWSNPLHIIGGNFLKNLLILNNVHIIVITHPQFLVHGKLKGNPLRKDLGEFTGVSQLNVPAPHPASKDRSDKQPAGPSWRPGTSQPPGWGRRSERGWVIRRRVQGELA